MYPKLQNCSYMSEWLFTNIVKKKKKRCSVGGPLVQAYKGYFLQEDIKMDSELPSLSVSQCLVQKLSPFQYQSVCIVIKNKNQQMQC